MLHLFLTQDLCKTHSSDSLSDHSPAPDAPPAVADPDMISQLLVVDPATNATDTIAFGGVNIPNWLTGRTSSRRLYQSIAFAPNTNKFYCAPADASHVLIIDPVNNSTSVLLLPYLDAGGSMWMDIVFSPVTNKLCEWQLVRLIACASDILRAKILLCFLVQMCS